MPSMLANQISIHEVFADLDQLVWDEAMTYLDFNPRGLRRPRRSVTKMLAQITTFQSTRSSQTSTKSRNCLWLQPIISIHEVFADLDGLLNRRYHNVSISIHEVFADLD